MISPISSLLANPVYVRPVRAVPGERLSQEKIAQAGLADTKDGITPAASQIPNRSPRLFGRALDTQQSASESADLAIGRRARRYSPAETRETKDQGEVVESSGFAPNLVPAEDPASSLLAVKPAQLSLDSASFALLYAKAEGASVASFEDARARSFTRASDALAATFSAGDELAIDFAA